MRIHTLPHVEASAHAYTTRVVLQFVPALCCALGAKWLVMDAQTLVQALGNTLDPNLRKQAEALLEEVGRTVWPSGC